MALSEKKTDLVLLLYGITLMAMLIFLITDAGWINYIRYIYTAIMTVLLIAKKHVYKINSLFFIFWILILHTVLFGYIFVPDEIKATVYDNAKEMIIFWLFIFTTAQYVYQHKEQVMFVKISQLCMSLFLNYCYITHFNGIAPIKLLPYILSESGRIRFTFGLGATNRAAYLALSVLILSDMVIRNQGGYTLKLKTSMYKLYVLASMAISILVILSTQTRGAILAGAIYFVIFGKGLFKKRKAIRFCVRVLVPVCLAVYAVYVFGIAINRSTYLITNWTIYLQHANPWLGLGYIPFSGFLSDIYHYGTAPMDCFYLYIICTTGIVGACFIIGVLIYLLYSFSNTLQMREVNEIDKRFISVYVVMLFISFSESLIIAPFVPYSYVLWVGFLLVLMNRGTIRI